MQNKELPGGYFLLVLEFYRLPDTDLQFSGNPFEHAFVFLEITAGAALGSIIGLCNICPWLDVTERKYAIVVTGIINEVQNLIEAGRCGGFRLSFCDQQAMPINACQRSGETEVCGTYRTVEPAWVPSQQWPWRPCDSTCTIGAGG